MKSLGQRSAGKPPAALDVAGAGDVPIGNAPVFEPTGGRGGRKFFPTPIIGRLRTVYVPLRTGTILQPAFMDLTFR